MASRGDADFLVSLNMTEDLLVSVILPLFDTERHNVSFGGPYRTGMSNRGRKSQLDSIDVIGLVLWFLKSRDRIYKL